MIDPSRGNRGNFGAEARAVPVDQIGPRALVDDAQLILLGAFAVATRFCNPVVEVFKLDAIIQRILIGYAWNDRLPAILYQRHLPHLVESQTHHNVGFERVFANGLLIAVPQAFDEVLILGASRQLGWSEVGDRGAGRAVGRAPVQNHRQNGQKHGFFYLHHKVAKRYMRLWGL
jgi:hypothetical protein